MPSPSLTKSSGVCLTINAVADAAYRGGFRGEGLTMAVAISCAENSTHQTDLIGYNYEKPSKRAPSTTPVAHPDNPTAVVTSRDRGLWQINDKAHPDVSDAQAFDPLEAAKAAYRISGGGKNWAPWTTFRLPKGNEAYKKWVPDAQRAAAGAAERAGGPAGQPAPTAPAAPAPVAARIPVLLPYGGAVDSLPVDTVPIYPSDLRLQGGYGGLNRGIGGGLIAAESRTTEIAVDLALKEQSEMRLTFADPGLAAFNLGLLLPGLQVDLADLHFVTVAVELGNGPAGETVTVTCRDLDAEDLKRDRLEGVTGPHTAFAYLEAVTNGLDYIYEDTPAVDVRKVIDKEDPTGRLQTTWAVLDKWADGIGYLFNVGHGSAFFARPSAIAAVMPGVVVKVAPGIQPAANHPDAPFLSIGVPKVRRLSDEADTGASWRSSKGLTSPVTGAVDLPQRRAARIRPGMRLELYGMASFDGSYLITKVSGKVDNDLTPWTVEFETPLDPTPTDPAFAPTAPTVTPSTVATPGAGTKQASDFVALCQAQAGKTYIYGAEARLDDPNPKAFDCSELVQWAASRTGVAFPDGSGAQYAASTRITVDAAARIRGALLFRGTPASPGRDHVAVSLGDGKSTIEARGQAYGVVQGPISGRQWHGAGLIPGLTYQQQP